MSQATTTTPPAELLAPVYAVLDAAALEVATGRPFGSIEVLDLALDLRAALQDHAGFAPALATIDAQLAFNASRIVGNREVAEFVASVRADLDALRAL